MTEINKEEIKEHMTNKKCWICRRTDKESLSDFKKIVLDFDDKVDGKHVIPHNIKDDIKNDNIIVVPEGTELNSDMLMGFEAFNEETGDDVDIKSDHNIFTTIHLCPVCDAIFTDVWQSAQDNAIDDIKEEYNEKIKKAMHILTSDED